MTNPLCKDCQRPMHAHGKTRSGKPRWKCPVCGKATSLNGTGRPKGDTPPKTDAERSKAWRERRKKKMQDEG